MDFKNKISKSRIHGEKLYLEEITLAIPRRDFKVNGSWILDRLIFSKRDIPIASRDKEFEKYIYDSRIFAMSSNLDKGKKRISLDLSQIENIIKEQSIQGLPSEKSDLSEGVFLVFSPKKQKLKSGFRESF